MIPLSVPNICGNEWQYVKECLDTEWVSSAGQYVNRFEQDVCRVTGSAHAIAVVNGSAALQIALLLAGVRAGDEVIVPAITFIAPINVVSYLQAQPVFMDCDEFYNLDAAKTLRFLKEETEMVGGECRNRANGRRIAAIVPVHVFGHAVSLDEIVPACRERNIRIVEDATESIGTYYTSGAFNGKSTGSIGDFGCFSFNGNKIVTTGGGGMLVTDDEALAARARYLTTQAKDDPVRYVHDEVGYNYRLTNIQAAMGVAQLEKLSEFIKTKKANFARYRDGITDIPGLTLAEPPPYADCNHWFYALQIDAEVYGRDRESLMAALEARGVQTRPLWHPNHLQKPYVECQSYAVERALELWQKTLNLPCSSNLAGNEVDRVITALKNG